MPDTDEIRRQFYVAITRAKSNLCIHYNGNYLKQLSVNGLTYKEDHEIYPEPQQIALYLTHKDVQLGYFGFVQHRINRLYSGISLQVLEDGLGNSKGELVLKYSKKFREDLENYNKKGYTILSAYVNFMIYWKNDNKNEEIKIILPHLILQKNKYLTS